ncbi:MAG: 4Fe-4S binding protein [Chloroflexi bacterium]|jgi:ferredoxin-type protein NapH|nr:4Fe-4S binding protein [Chloroflexota bacterium]
MTTRIISATKSKRRKKSRFQLKLWPTVRFFFTIGFFILIGTDIWNGSTCVVDIGPLQIACPLGVAQLIAASRKIIPALLVGALVSLGLIFFFGRAFCSWICPGRWIFNRGPVKNSKPWKYRAWVQRVIVGGVVGAAFVCHNPIFCTICPAGVVCRGAIAAGNGGSVFPTIGWYTMLVGAEWATGRSWCRDMCPLGAAFSRISRWNPFLKIRRAEETCTPCVACQRACPEGLNLSKDTDFSTCTKCLECIAACPRGAVNVELLQIK